MMRPVLLVLASLAAAGCAADIAEPPRSADGLPAGLEVQLTVEPGEVGQHDAFTGQFTVTNVSTEVIQFIQPNSCLAGLRVRRDGQHVPFAGGEGGCRDMITGHTLAAGESRTRTWPMRAELFAVQAGDPHGAPAPAGTYVVQAEFSFRVYTGDASSVYTGDAFWTTAIVERPLRVR